MIERWRVNALIDGPNRKNFTIRNSEASLSLDKWKHLVGENSNEKHFTFAIYQWLKLSEDRSLGGFWIIHWSSFLKTVPAFFVLRFFLSLATTRCCISSYVVFRRCVSRREVTLRNNSKTPYSTSFFKIVPVCFSISYSVAWVIKNENDRRIKLIK